VGVGGRPLPQAVGLVDQDPQFLGGELGEPGGGAVGHEATGGHHLDGVGAHEVVEADLAADLVHGVRGPAGVVGVPAGGGDLRPGGDDARAAQVPGVDGVAQGDVDVVARPQALDAGDALAEQLARGPGRVEGEAGDLMGPVVGVLDIGAGGGQVVVGLDESGHESGPGQVHAHDSARVDAGQQPGQALLELAERPHRQDVPTPHQDRATPAGRARPGTLRLAEATTLDADGLETAPGPAAPTGQKAVGAHQSRRAPVEALSAVTGRSGPANGSGGGSSGGLSGGPGGRIRVGGLIGHNRSSIRGRRRSYRGGWSGCLRPAECSTACLCGPAWGERWRSGRNVPPRTRSRHHQNRGITRKSPNAPGVPTRTILPGRQNRDSSGSPTAPGASRRPDPSDCRRSRLPPNESLGLAPIDFTAIPTTTPIKRRATDSRVLSSNSYGFSSCILGESTPHPPSTLRT